MLKKLDGLKLFFICLLAVISFLSCNLIQEEEKNVIKTEVSIMSSGIPGKIDDSCNYYFVVASWKNGKLLDYIVPEFSIPYKEIVSKKYSINDEYTHISVFLFRKLVNYNPSYFYEFKRNYQESYSNSYWLDYISYFDNQTIKYGKSDTLTISPQFGTTYKLDFDHNPYYIFGFKNITNTSFSVYIDNPNESIIADAGYLNGTRDNELLLNKKVLYNNFNGDISILFEPFWSENNIECNVTFDIFNSEEVLLYQSNFLFNDVFYVGKKVLYFNDTYSKAFVKLDYTKKTRHDIKIFDNRIIDIVYSRDKKKLFIAEGNNIWEYVIETDVLLFDRTFDSSISPLWNSDDCLVPPPMKTFLDNSKVIDKDGNVYLKDANNTFVQNIGYDFVDLVFDDKYIYLIDRDKFIVLVLEEYEYILAATPILFEVDSEGKRIFIDDKTSKVIVLTQDINSFIYYHEYDLIKNLNQEANNMNVRSNIGLKKIPYLLDINLNRI